MNLSRPIVAALLLALLSAPTAETHEQPVTTVLLVHHAEKVRGQQDPPLSAAGIERSQKLARIAGQAGVTAVFATGFRRTQDTAAPLAERLGLEVTVVRGGARESSRELARAILSDFSGQVVLAAGHSNTLPMIMEALGIPSPPEIGEDQYDDLFVVTVGPAGARYLQLRY